MRTFLSTKRHLFAPLMASLIATQSAGCFSDEPPGTLTTSASETGSTTTPKTTTGGSATSTSSAVDTDGAGLCGAPDSNSHIEKDVCLCDLGYRWCSDDPDDKTCCESSTPGVCDGPYNQQIGDECFCVSGYEWCADDPDDYTCCEAGETGETGETGGMCDAPPPPDTCDPELELAWCSTTTEACLAESQYYICGQDGTWTPSDGTYECLSSGYDFSYGCIDDADQGLIEHICGSGPGTPCGDSDLNSCSDSDNLRFCAYSKLGTISCLAQCKNVGDSMGVTYDYGSCGQQDGEFKCLCCDFDEPGCGG